MGLWPAISALRYTALLPLPAGHGCGPGSRKAQKGAERAVILLVDNRDSYTFNLAHLIAEVTGDNPEVVRADDVFERDIPKRVAAGHYSHIVISPGPGTPDCARDFSGSQAVIAAADAIPVLGVCLGHQGLAHYAGGRIGRTAPRHGITSTITHSGEGIFSGLPQNFTVVRYHSLHVAEDVDTSRVRIHARSEDGVVQGLEVIGQPHWGVQFHPESVLTQYGRELMRNFFSLHPATSPQRDEHTWTITHESIDGAIDTEATARALLDSGHDAFWLDSATGDGFSIIGTGAGSLSRSLSFQLGDSDTDEDVLTRLDAELEQSVDTRGLPDLPFRGGWIGFLGYECLALTLPGVNPRHRSAYPDAYFLRPQSFLVYDHTARRTHFMVCSRADHEVGAQEHALLAELKKAVRTQPVCPNAASLHEGSWRLSRDDYRERFSAVKEALARGDSYEVCLTDTYEATATGEGIDLYVRLRRANPAPYSAYLRLGGVEVLSSSPERFLTVRDGRVETKPIKGTLPRELPAQLLCDDPKTRAENLMIVDLLRNDLSRVCVPGTVSAPRLMQVETYATVHQLVSTVTGQLRPGTGVVDILRATFPGGSMTGAPKDRTCRIIDELETGPRGVYSGVIGYLGFDGRADLSIAIRTAVKQGEAVTVGAGGAIVWDSTAEAEFNELHLKADAVIGGMR